MYAVSMSLKRLTAFVVLVELIGLGVMFSFLLGVAITHGGIITLDTTQFGEMWIEYFVILGVLAVTPYALYITDQNITRE